MSFYPKKISERFHEPRSVGAAANANAGGAGAGVACGAVLRLTLQIETETKTILDARFKTNGCGFAMAAAEVLAEKIIGKKLTDLHGSENENLKTEIEAALGAFPAARAHCLDLTIESLHNAFADFRARQIEEFAGERALICTCFGVSEETIEKLIRENSLETVEDVTDACRAGGGCGSCQLLIEDILDVYWREAF